MTCGGAALLVTSRGLFWLLGALLGLFVGPAQAAGRSYLARAAPAHLRTELFGLFALSEFAVSGPPVPGLVFGYGAAPPPAIDAGLRRLSRIVA